MTFSSQPWAARFAQLGDAAEKKFVEHVDGRCVRWGLERPEGIHVPHLPARVRSAPDFLQSTPLRFVEAMGLGRGQHLQLKLEKFGCLRYWNDLLPVVVFIWDSHKRRKCIIGLNALDALIQTPDLCEFGFFDERKLVFRIPADAIWEVASDGT